MLTASKLLTEGRIAVIPTDTLYGIVGQALNKEVVSRIYNLKNRDPEKPFVILISSIKDLFLFEVNLEARAFRFLEKFWPGQVSVILPCTNQNFEYLHRGTQTLAFRIPNKKNLIELLQKTGPLVAPSANPEGEKPAETIEEAMKYFGSKVDLYVNEGKLSGKPSTLVSVKDGEILILRDGAVKL